ncbi:hypothetical protein N9D02_09260 [Emcibacteraceae bacterium]|nr:hypothetical protein [Emcibacteraceae bacterium]
MRYFLLVFSVFLMSSCAQNKTIQHFEAVPAFGQNQSYNQGILTLQSNIGETGLIMGIDPIEVEKNEGFEVNLSIANFGENPIVFDPEEITHSLKSENGEEIPVKILYYNELITEASSIGGGLAAALQGFGAGVSDDQVEKARYDMQMAKREQSRENATRYVEQNAIRITTISRSNTVSGFYKINSLDILEGQKTLLKIIIPVGTEVHIFNIELGR